MEVRIAQSSPCNAIHGRSGYDAAERAWCTETLVIRHDEQHVGRPLRRHDSKRPPWFGLNGFLLDHPAEFRVGRRKLLAADGDDSAGRTRLTGNALCHAERGIERNDDA